VLIAPGMARYGDSDKATKAQGEVLRRQGQRWLARIKAQEKLEDTWLKDADAAVSAYTSEKAARDSGSSDKLYDFNILFANVETIVPAVINSPPAPDIRRRFGDDDPVAKDVAELLERVMRVQVDDSKLQTEMEAQAQDGFLAGRGIIRLRFKAKVGGEVSRDDIREAAEDDDAATDGGDRDDAVSGSDEGAGAGYAESAGSGPVREQAAGKAVSGEYICFEAVSWRDYRHGPAKRWEDRPWDAFRHAIANDEMEGFQDAPLVASQQDGDERKAAGETDDDIVVWEIWDKKHRRVDFVRDADGVIVKRVKDPLGLTNFFCIGTPVQPIEVTGRLMPVNPFAIYRKLADELDNTTRRINALTDAMRVKGWYSGDASDLEAVVKAEDQDFVPIKDAEVWAQHGGLQGAIAFWPIEKFITVLRELYVSRNETKQAIYEITGISDIIRGASNAAETLGAQEIKTQWGSLRIQKMQRMMQRSARDLFVMMSEIIPDKFSAKTLQDISTIQLIPTKQDQTPVPMPPMPPLEAQIPPEQMQQVQQAAQQAQQQEQARQAKLAHMEAITELLKQPVATFYRVDVESDSTVRADLTRQKTEATEFMTAAGGYFGAVGPLVETGTMPADVAAEIFSGVARMFNMPKSAEDAIERWLAGAREQAKQPKQEKPDPEAMKAQTEQAKAESTARAAEASAQTANAKAQADIARINAEGQASQQEHAAKMAEMQAGAAQSQQENALKLAEMDAKLEADRQTHAQTMQKGQLELDKLRAEILKIQAGTISAVESAGAKADLAERNQEFKEKQAKANGKADA
jgi:hypothetical protein